MWADGCNPTLPPREHRREDLFNVYEVRGIHLFAAYSDVLISVVHSYDMYVYLFVVDKSVNNGARTRY